MGINKNTLPCLWVIFFLKIFLMGNLEYWNLLLLSKVRITRSELFTKENTFKYLTWMKAFGPIFATIVCLGLFESLGFNLNYFFILLMIILWEILGFIWLLEGIFSQFVIFDLIVNLVKKLGFSLNKNHIKFLKATGAGSAAVIEIDEPGKTPGNPMKNEDLFKKLGVDKYSRITVFREGLWYVIPFFPMTDHFTLLSRAEERKLTTAERQYMYELINEIKTLKAKFGGTHTIEQTFTWPITHHRYESRPILYTIDDVNNYAAAKYFMLLLQNKARSR